MSAELTTLQAMRSDAERHHNRRLAAVLSLAIAELIGVTDKSINADIKRYNDARKRQPHESACGDLFASPVQSALEV